jgi:transcription antitermination factor NusG
MIRTKKDSRIPRQWYALYTKPRSEFKAEAQISASHIETYLPIISEIRQWKDRKKTVLEPILRGYIFIKADEAERRAALAQVRCICERGRPAAIPEVQILNLKNFIHAERQYVSTGGIMKGTKVRITNGPFKDVEGVVVQETNGKYLAVSIELLKRTILTYISDEDLLAVVRKKN